MKILVFLGSVRVSTPPAPARLGMRVARACLRELQARWPDAELLLVDPLAFVREPVFKPHFAYARRDVPADLEQLAADIRSADAYVMVSPEYNHSMSPALADLLNHFGSSLFAFKPSAIVTYSAGQWGGARAAVNMRTFLGELGCLPVSAMIHVPAAHTVFDDEGEVAANQPSQHWQDYMGRTFLQLHWWAEAARQQREQGGLPVAAFVTAPSQRNAPG